VVFDYLWLNHVSVFYRNNLFHATLEMHGQFMVIIMVEFKF
jgi:hypothetical protein